MMPLIRWSDPEDGFYTGEIAGEEQSEAHFLLEDDDFNDQWILIFDLRGEMRIWAFQTFKDAQAQAERVAYAMYGPTVEEENLAKDNGLIDEKLEFEEETE